MSQSVLTSSPSVAVTGGNNAFGAWTTIFVPPIRLNKMLFTISAVAPPTYGGFNIGLGGGSSPEVVLPSGLITSGLSSAPLPVYLACGAGVPIQMQTFNQNGTTDVCLVNVTGISDSSIIPCSYMSVIGSPPTFGVTAINTAWTSLGSTQPTKLRKLTLCMVSGAANSQYCTINIGIGPSSSAIQTVIANLGFAAAANYAGWYVDIDLDLPPSQQLWAIASNTVPIPRMVIYAYY